MVHVTIYSIHGSYGIWKERMIQHDSTRLKQRSWTRNRPETTRSRFWKIRTWKAEEFPPDSAPSFEPGALFLWFFFPLTWAACKSKKVLVTHRNSSSFGAAGSPGWFPLEQTFFQPCRRWFYALLQAHDCCLHCHLFSDHKTSEEITTKAARTPCLRWRHCFIMANLRYPTKKTRCSPRTRMLTRMLMVQMSKHMDMQSRRTLACNSLYEQSCTYFPCYQSGVWSGKCRVWSVECKVWSVECGV